MGLFCNSNRPNTPLTLDLSPETAGRSSWVARGEMGQISVAPFSSFHTE